MTYYCYIYYYSFQQQATSTTLIDNKELYTQVAV